MTKITGFVTPPFIHYISVQEITYIPGHYISIFFKGKVSGIEQIKLDILKITLVKMGTIGQSFSLSHLSNISPEY